MTADRTDGDQVFQIAQKCPDNILSRQRDKGDDSRADTELCDLTTFDAGIMV